MKTAFEKLDGSELNGRHIKLTEKAEASKRSPKRSPSIGSRARSRSPRARSLKEQNLSAGTVTGKQN